MKEENFLDRLPIAPGGEASYNEAKALMILLSDSLLAETMKIYMPKTRCFR